MTRKKLSPSEAVGSRSNFVKAVQGVRDAEEMQPWRCIGCGTAVRRGFNDWCPCLGVTRLERMISAVAAGRQRIPTACPTWCETHVREQFQYRCVTIPSTCFNVRNPPTCSF